MAPEFFKYLRDFPIVTFEKGEMIYHCNDKIDYVYYLIEGSCMRMSNTPNGEEIFMDERTSDDSVSAFLGSLAAITQNRLMTYSLVTTTKCRCYKIQHAEFIDFLHQYPSIMFELLQMAVSQYEYLAANFFAKQKGQAAPRIASFIIDKAEEMHEGLLLHRHYTNTDIARFLAMHRITVNKVIIALEDEGCLRRIPEGILIIDLALLQTYAHGERKLHYKK